MNIHMYMYIHIGGGFSPIEKYQSNWIISPTGEITKHLKPPPSRVNMYILYVKLHPQKFNMELANK